MMMRRGDAIFGGRRRRRWGRWVLGVIALAIALCGAYTAVDNGRVVIREQLAVVHSLPEGLEGFTILHISDLNGKRFGPGQKQLANTLKNKKYSAVCITGDMIGPNGDLYPFYELLSALDPSKPVFFIAGDHDPAPVGGQQTGYYTVTADWVLGAETRGATFVDAPASITVGSHAVWFSDAAQLMMDLEQASSAYAEASTPFGAYSADIIAQTKQARAQMRQDDLHIALLHKPLSADASEMMLNITDESGTSFARQVDLFLAGGTVGGQWRIPFVGPVWYEGWFPDDSQVLGYQRAGILPQSQYISGGLGTDEENPLPGFRFFNTPSVTLITFASEYAL